MQVIIILLIGLAFGVNIASGIPGALLILFISAAFGFVWSGVSLFVALNTKSSQTTLSVGLLTTFPLLFLSAAVLPLGLLPSWVQQVAKYNPFTYIAQAFQSLMIKGFSWQPIEDALISIITGMIAIGATFFIFRNKIS